MVVTATLLKVVLVVTGFVLLLDIADSGGWLSALPALLGVAVAMGSVLAGGAVSGAAYASRAVHRPVELRSGSILGMSVLAIVVGAEVAALVIGILAIPTAGPLAPLGALAFGTMAAIAFCLPALVVVVPHPVAWRGLMRRVAGTMVAA